ncbi:Crp/Fnr family transcriptional regulator [Chitinophaga rhizophila]|uniref:Crp/Fnr family transcriptional regulator n=1 Tax=Chitinophaga rhizophila TaxID=2866212 RepID=A0ABS7G841_9BACT|nr:Crp/Fnr family transcriptional regulator [Chitinophaga rhizophila]MBW8683809.1 Crp/Fnr family transcriptional regulator [Chitinophaga rhizophila]
MQRLIAHISRFVDLTEEDKDTILSVIQYQQVKKKDHLLRQDMICNANYFILKGCFRRYYIDEKGTEQTIQFAIDNWWITDYDSMEKRSPSSYFIQAVETGEVAILDKRIQEELFQKVPVMERYFRLVLQRSYAAAIQRIRYIYEFSGEERYNHFSSLFPEFLQRIPQYMLASYLGFTPEFLSKIRAKKN